MGVPRLFCCCCYCYYYCKFFRIVFRGICLAWVSSQITFPHSWVSSAQTPRRVLSGQLLGTVCSAQAVGSTESGCTASWGKRCQATRAAWNLSPAGVGFVTKLSILKIYRHFLSPSGWVTAFRKPWISGKPTEPREALSSIWLFMECFLHVKPYIRSQGEDEVR